MEKLLDFFTVKNLSEVHENKKPLDVMFVLLDSCKIFFDFMFMKKINSKLHWKVIFMSIL